MDERETYFEGESVYMNEQTQLWCCLCGRGKCLGNEQIWKRGRKSYAYYFRSSCKVISKERKTELPPFLLRIGLSSNQILNNHVPVAIVFLVIVSENVLTIAVIENMLIDKENDTHLWIRYPFNMHNVFNDRNL